MILTHRKRLGAFPALPKGIVNLTINGGMPNLTTTAGGGVPSVTKTIATSAPVSSAPPPDVSAGPAPGHGSLIATAQQLLQGQAAAATEAWDYAVAAQQKIRPWVWLVGALALGTTGALVYRKFKRRRAA